MPGKEGILGSRKVSARDDRQGRARRDVVLPLSPITAALQAYADRGVFRGFHAAAGAGGRVEYQFLWLTRQPVTAVFDARRERLHFPALFPGVDAQAAKALRALVVSRAGRGVPAHKRLDQRRARLAGNMRGGDFSLAVDVRGSNHGYAVGHALNLINEMFVGLHEAHPEYLVSRFGISAE